MWGLQIKPHLRVAAWALSLSMPLIGQGHRLPPGSRLDHHVLVDGFKDNLLTRDQKQFDIMREQLEKYPALSLGGPSFVWLREALQETRHLAGRASPDVPCLTFLGSNERIVAIDAISSRMEAWPKGRLEIVPEGEHEVLMEGPDVTGPLFDQMAAHYLGPTGG
jgi:lysophospholipase